MRKPIFIILGIVLVGLVAAGVWWFLTAQNEEPATTTQTSETNTPRETTSTSNTTDSGEVEEIVIVFNDQGFEQQSYTVAVGQTVTLKNESSIDVEFSSDDHPTHTKNTELNMAPLQPNQQLSFTPEVTGEWGIHDHIHPGFTTTLVVTD